MWLAKVANSGSTRLWSASRAWKASLVGEGSPDLQEAEIQATHEVGDQAMAQLPHELPGYKAALHATNGLRSAKLAGRMPGASLYELPWRRRL